MPVHTHCVVIELERVDEGRMLKYLYEHVYSYNWILKEDEETDKVRVCVWWREEEYRQFCTTPLRSFIKRLKNKTAYDSIKISKAMSTEEGIQAVCKGVRGSISKYYLEPPLCPYLSEWLSTTPPRNEEQELRPNTKCNHILKMIDTLDISMKLELLQKITAAVAAQVNQRLSAENVPSSFEVDVPSPLSTHTGESTTSSLFPELKMEQSFEDPFLPVNPSGPTLFKFF